MDTDALLAALEPPQVTIGGETFTGRHPTFTERMEIERAWVETNWDDVEEQHALVRLMCEKVGIPAEKVLDLPELIMTAVMLHFLKVARGLDGTMIPSNELNAASA